MFEIESMEMIEGDLPGRARRLVVEWATPHKTELVEMWKTQRFQQPPGLE